MYSGVSSLSNMSNAYGHIQTSQNVESPIQGQITYLRKLRKKLKKWWCQDIILAPSSGQQSTRSEQTPDGKSSLNISVFCNIVTS